METEKSASDRKGKEHINPHLNSKKKKKKNKRQRKENLLAVQKLFETCNEVFADCGPGIAPSPENVQRLKAVLDEMTEADVGLTQDMPIFINHANDDQVPRIAYVHLYESTKFSIGIFCLQPTSVIPLHNHPGMTVFGKLLFGTMHIKSYDWVDNAGPVQHITGSSPSSSGHVDGEVRLAKVKVNGEFTAPCSTNILYPADGGNMHCLTARTPCAVLDVLGPPYSDAEGRHCQYYVDFPSPNLSGSDDGVSALEDDGANYAWLKEREKPEDLTVERVKYTGPKIVPKRLSSHR